MKNFFKPGKARTLDKGSIFICAGEPSGDFHASSLAREIFRRLHDVRISGVGGKLMKEQGVDIFYDCRNLAVMGITDVIARSRIIFDAYSRVSSFLADNMPGIVILVDYPGFNLKVAEKASNLGIPVFYYISPKVWAWGSGRIEKIRRYVDHIGLILPFEEAFYRKYGVNATFVGNPLVDLMPEPVQGLKKSHERRVVGLLPGSRSGEISRHLPVMLGAASIIKKKVPDVEFVVSLPFSGKNRREAENLVSASGLDGCAGFETGDVRDIFEKADILVAASGTVTLEAAVAGVPTVIIYIMSEISFRIAKTLVRVDYAGLANLIAGREVSPELLQEDASPEKIAGRIINLLENPEALEKMKADFRLVRKKLGKPGAAGRAADIVVSILAGKNKKEKFIR